MATRSNIPKQVPVQQDNEQTKEGFAKEKHPKFEIYTDNSGEFRSRLKATNGQIIGVSEGYKAHESCVNGVESVKKNSVDAPVVEE